MKTSFSPSVNIIRDEQRDFQYIPTPNTNQIFNQLQDSFEKGLRSFNLIGSYGTGKSSFLLAVEQTLTNAKPHFVRTTFANANCQFIKIIGSYSSVIDAFASHLDISTEKHISEHIFSELFNQYHLLGKKSPLLVIVIDELGKFLEHAAKNSPEKELYFLQQLAEFANNADNNILLITTVHQSFETYSYELNRSVRHEWTKVKGRFKEITFNEPVEQLLFLASEHIFRTAGSEGNPKSISKALDLFEYSNAFKAEYSKEIATKIYPLDVLSANVLTLALQRYGQNERSLFSFLESTDLASISNYKTSVQSPFYSLANVFDYLTNNFFTFLNSKYNPDLASWAAIKIAIEHVENSFDANLTDYLKIVKSIGLLNIFSNAGSILDEWFLTAYSKTCLGIKEPKQLIEQLESKSIIRFRKHSKRFVLTEEAEIDIELALINATQSVSEITDVATVLKKYFEFAPALAKEYNYINGTSRYFQFEITEHPKVLKPYGEIDGYIQLVFNDHLKDKFIKEQLEDSDANIYVYYENAKEIKALLFELEKTQKVLLDNQKDKVAKRELESIIVHQKALLNHYILNNLYSGSKDIAWYWQNSVQPISSKKAFNKLLTQVCKFVYYGAPAFKNELVNKHKISSAIHTAKRNYFKGLANHWDLPDLGIPENKFPPEKMIYKSLLQDNGLAPYKKENEVALQIKEGDSFFALWQASNTFLESTKGEKKSLTDLVEILSQKPFKLKQGFIDFWLPSFLFLKRDDFALYVDNSFLPTLSDETLELMAKKPKDFQIKAFDIEGVRLDIFNSYRIILNQETKEKLGTASFIETIKPFLVFYKTLPEYAKQTIRLNKPALAIREAISKSKDPEQTFFEAFPAALETSINELNQNNTSLTQYTETLQNAIREIRTCFDALIERFESFIKHDILFEDQNVGFELMKQKLQNRYINIKRHLLLQKQKSFVQRIDSLLDEKKSWLSSLCQALLGKPLENIHDDEEILLYDAFKNMVHELDSLTELSSIEIDEEKEQVYNIQFATFGNVPLKNIIRVSKVQNDQLGIYIEKVEQSLTADPEINKLIVTSLLQKLLSNG